MLAERYLTNISTYSEGGSSNGVGIGSRTERIHLFQDNFWNLQNFTFYCPWHEACLSRISYFDVLEMLLPRYEADNKGHKDGGKGHSETFFSLLCLANNAVVSNT